MQRNRLASFILHSVLLFALIAGGAAASAASRPAPARSHVVALTAITSPALAALNARIPVVALGAGALAADEPTIRAALAGARALTADVAAFNVDAIKQTAWFRLAHQLNVPIVLENADAPRMAAITGFGQGGRLVVLRPSQAGRHVAVAVIEQPDGTHADPTQLASMIEAQLAAPAAAALPGNLPPRAVRSWDITTGAWHRSIKGAAQTYTEEVNFAATLYDGVFSGQSRKLLVIDSGSGAGFNATAGGALESDSATDRGYYLESLLVDVRPVTIPSGMTLLSYAPAAENSEGTYAATTGIGVEGSIDGPPTVSINHEQTETQQVKDFRVSAQAQPFAARWLYQLSRVGDAIPYRSWSDLVNNTHIQYPLFTLLPLPPLAKGETLLPINQSVWTMPSDFQDQVTFRFTHQPTMRRVWRTTPAPGGWNFANQSLLGAAVQVDWTFDFSQVNFRGDIGVAAQNIAVGPAAPNGTRSLSARITARLADYQDVTVGFYQGPPSDPSSKPIGSTTVDLTQQFDWRVGGRIGAAVAQVEWSTAGLPGTQNVWVRVGKPDGTPIDGELDKTNNIASRAINLGAPGVNMSKASVNIAEGGAGDSYQVTLNTQPAANVTIAINGGAQASANPKTLSFAPANWNVPQTVTIGATDDSLVEGPHSATIGHTASSSDPGYNAIAIAPIVASVVDNDNVSPITVHVSQSGAQDSYQFVLTRQPAANVAVAITTDGKTTTSPTTLNFTASNWNTPQSVVVSAIDNHDMDGPLSGTITHHATSADPSYNNVDLSGVVVNIRDHSGEAAPIDVTTAADTIAADGACSLREAVQAANTNTPVNECAVSATDYHVINLAAAGPYDLSRLNNPNDGVDSALQVNSSLIVNGNGQTLRNHNPNGTGRLFDINQPGDLTVNDLTMRDGRHFGAGAIWVYKGATANLYRSTLTHNETISFAAASTSGGAIINQGTLNIYASTLSDNVATGNNLLSQNGGGAILNAGNLNIANSTLAGNRANMNGGAIQNSQGNAWLTNVTITGNTADADGDGAGAGGGIAIADGHVELKNSIVAGNFDTANNAGTNADTPDLGLESDIPALPVYFAQIISNGYNLIGNLGAFNLIGNTTGDRYGDPRGSTTPNLGATEQATPIDARLGAPTGSPAVQPLLAGSPAIDRIPLARCAFAGTPGNPLFANAAPIAIDQRGGERPRGLRCDIGAYEIDQVAVDVSTGSLDVPTGRTGGTYQLVLKHQPANDVTITLHGDANTSLSPAALVFTPANWNVPQAVTVTARAATAAKAAAASTGMITHSVTSADPSYNGLAVADIGVTIFDSGVPAAAHPIYLPIVRR